MPSAVQRLYRYDSSGNKVLAAEQTVRDRLFFHTAHGHFHFPLASFGLYAVTSNGGVGEPVALSPKNGFCIADSGQIDPTLAHSPGSMTYAGDRCVDPTATLGIDPGWADLYDRRDPGQAIDITGLPDGIYWFNSKVDPGDNFLESDKTNNTTSIKVQISGDTVTPVSPLVSQGSFVVDKSFLDRGTGDGDTPAFSTTYANDLLVAFVSASGPATTKQTATVSGGGLTWKLATRSNTRAGTSEVWTARASGTVNNAVVTSKLSSSGYAQALAVYALAGAGDIGATATADGATGAPSVGLTTTKAGSWVMGAGNDPAHWIPRTPASGQVLVHQALGEYFGTGTQWIQAPTSPTPNAGTPVTLADSYPVNDPWNYVSVEITPAQSADTTAPVISGGQAASVGSDRARIAWNTDEPSSTRVTYGTTSEYGQATSVDPALVLNHQQDLTGLTPSTDYFCQLESTDASGNTAVAVGPTFKTTAVRTAPPVFSNVRLSDLQPDAATFAWTTDELADSQVEVGTTTSYGTSSTRNPALVESHFVTLNGLVPNTTYHYRVRSTDAYANVGASDDLTFTTPGIPPPIVVDQTVSNDGPGTVSTPGISTAQPNELLAAYVTADGPTGQTATVSGGGLTWTLAARSNAQPGSSEVWTATASAKTTNAAVTSTLSRAGYDQSLTVVAYQGAVGVGDTEVKSGTSGVPDLSVKAIRTGSLVYGAGNDWSQATARTVGSGQTKVHEWVDTRVGDTFWVQRRTANAGPVESIVDLGTTAPTSTRWNLVGVEIVRPVSIPPATAPVITGVNTSNVTATGATVTWTTDQPSSSKVEYGTTTAYGSSTALDPTGVAAHSQSLTGLAASTTYHYRVISSTVNGTTTSPDATFTTPATPPAPVITGVNTSNVTATGATVTWTTDQPSSSKVEYGTTTAYGSSTALDPTGVAAHSQSLTGLAASTTYHYRVISSTVNGTTTSPDATFTTLATPPPGTSPVVDAKVTVNGKSSTTTAGLTTPSSDDLLLAFVAADGPSSGGQTATVTGGATWTLVQRVNTQAGVAEVWKARASGLLSGAQVTAKASKTGYDQSLTVVAVKDGRGGTSAGASAKTGAPSVALTTTADQAIVFGVGNDWDGAVARTLPAGRSIVSQWVDTSAGDTFWVQRRDDPVTTAGTVVTTSDTAPTNHRWNLVAIEVLPL